MFLFQLDEDSGCHCSYCLIMGNFKIAIDCFVTVLQIFLQIIYKMVLDKSSSNNANFVQMTDFDSLLLQQVVT